MRRSKPPALSIYEARRILNPIRKWPVGTGALLGAALSSGVEIVWRGFAMDWNFLSDRAQEMITIEILLASIVIGGVCGALVCLIRNQQKGATAEEE
jgi:hypothetical protein